MKRLLSVLILLNGSSLLAMQKRPLKSHVTVTKSPPIKEDTQTKKELAIIDAIARGDVMAVRKELDAGLNVNKPFTITGFRGHTPLSVALMDKIPVYVVRNNTLQLVQVKDNSPNKYKIAESLIAQGADNKQLNELFAGAVANKNAVKALWIAKHSKLRPDNNVIETIKRLTESASPADKILWAEVHNRLQKPTEQLPVRVVTSEEQKELDLFNALQKRDLEAVKRAIAAGASPKEFKHISWLKDLSAKDRRPFGWVALDEKGYKILEYLLTTGIDKHEELTDLLFIAVHEGNKPEVEWVLARIDTVEPRIIAHAIERADEEKEPAKKAVYDQIKKLLETKK